MRAIAFFFYDPAAPRGEPTTRVRMEGTFRRYCAANHHTLEQSFAFPQGQTTPEEALGEVCRFLEAQRGAPVLVALVDPFELGSSPQAAVETLLKLDSLNAQVVGIEPGQGSPLPVLYAAIAPPEVQAPQPSQRAKNIREAMLQKAARGEGLGKPPYGYRLGESDKLEAAFQEAEVVRLIFRLYVEQGQGIRNIVKELNSQGHRTRRDANWSMVTIRDILRNPAYVGTYRRFGMRIPRSHAAIVDRETFRKAQDLMDSRAPMRRRAVYHPFLLSGLAVCGQCGNNMIGVTRQQTWRNKDGARQSNRYRYYQCQSRTNQSVCQYHTWRDTALEEATLAEVRRQVLQRPELLTTEPPPLRDAVVQSPPQEGFRRRYLAYVKQAAEGAITLSRLRELVERLRREEQAALEAHPAGTEEGSPFTGAALVEESRWDALNEAQQREGLERWVQRIVVAGGAVTVRLRL
ncbi:MAG: recombinase family protein [Chloroflexi bacterium]|nr:recombinase family protein [Chloroflexota bacterium]